MKIDIILLASGYGRRFGGNKLVYSFEGRTLFGTALDNALALGESLPDYIDNVRAVSQYDEIKRICCEKGAEYIHNPHSGEGISASVRIGTQSCTPDNSVMLMVCDQPYMCPESLKGLVLEYISSQCGIACFTDGRGNISNPAVFSPLYRAELLSLKGDRGGKGIIKRHIDDAVLVPVDDKELMDIDTPK